MVADTRITNKNILLGVTGGIAAYKSAELIRLLRKQGAHVRVVMTQSAQEFMTPLTLQTLSGNPVKTDCWSLESESEIDHIALARWADLLVIAPASANCIAKLANGIADDLLSTICLATTAPVAVAPAMNQQMWAHQATGRNIKQLEQDGVAIWGPACGSQACGETGPGRLVEPDILLDMLDGHFERHAPSSSLVPLNLAGKHILMTAGPTREPLDPVRYLTNHSSGKMGFALAEALVAAKAKVTLVAGPVELPVPKGLECLTVITAQEMHDAVMANLPGQDIFIGTAAVADYTPVNVDEQKIKKEVESSHCQLELVKTPDILADVAASNAHSSTPLFTVGFAAETEKLLEHAEAKRQRKKVDLLCANWVGRPGVGFGTDTNEITVLADDGHTHLNKAPKRELAERLVAVIAEKFYEKRSGKNSQREIRHRDSVS